MSPLNEQRKQRIVMTEGGQVINVEKVTVVKPVSSQWTLDQGMWELSCRYANSSAVPDSYRGKPDDVYVILNHAKSLGILPLEAMQGMYILKGRVCIWGDLLLALCMRHPEFEDIQETMEGEGDAMVAKCVVKRKNRSPTICTFSVKQAMTAGLWGKNVWKQYPERMLKMRARVALRDAFPDALHGMSLYEEIAYIDGDVAEVATEVVAIEKPNDTISLPNPLTNEVAELIARLPEENRAKLTKHLADNGLSLESAGEAKLQKLKDRCLQIIQEQEKIQKDANEQGVTEDELVAQMAAEALAEENASTP
jgi:hypothetical protein